MSQSALRLLHDDARYDGELINSSSANGANLKYLKAKNSHIIQPSLKEAEMREEKPVVVAQQRDL